MIITEQTLLSQYYEEVLSMRKRAEWQRLENSNIVRALRLRLCPCLSASGQRQRPPATQMAETQPSTPAPEAGDEGRGAAAANQDPPPRFA